MMAADKTCFVITPIGSEGSECRIRSDQVLKHIIGPAAAECGYRSIRADQISDPGIITSQVITHIVEDDLVIADLTGHNPNVFYELALRHAVRKPIVQIMGLGENVPFDIAATRMIFVNHHDLDSAARAREEIVNQIRAAECDSSHADSPISIALDLQALRQSDNPLEKSSAEIMSILQHVNATIVEMRSEQRAVRAMDSITREEFTKLLLVLSEICELDDSPSIELLRDLFDRIRDAEHVIKRLLRGW